MNGRVLVLILAVISGTMILMRSETNRSEIYRYDRYINDNFETYKELRASVADTIQNWTKDSLECTKSIFYGDCWEVDSLFLFDRDSVRFFTTLNLRDCKLKGSRTDWIQGLIGIKSEGKWHFHFGSNHIIGRGGRISDKYTPLTAEQISYIAHSSPTIMGRFLKVYDEGRYEVNYDELYDYFFKRYRAYYPDISKIDSLEISRIAYYRKKKLTQKEIDSVREFIANSKRPPLEKKPWWKRVFSREPTPLFETEEWKNRRKG